ncbi:MAG: DUF4143 domain-containing protein [Candidatus Latescibacteria bacterium]|nr:DUF4143 domain-containing protein [Candidatus Latescibacterota bacterium]
MRRRYETDDGLLLRELGGRANVEAVFIDEIQKVPALLDDIQLLYDREPARYQFLLTGSSARQLRRGSANLLPGRSQQYILSPVLQAEQRAAAVLPLDMPAGARFPARSLESYLLHGNLPGFYGETVDSWQETLETYVDLYIENEIRQENIVRDMGAFARFLRLAATEAGQLVNYARMANTVGVAVNTLRNFYQVLEDTFVGLRIAPLASGRKRVVKAPRFVFFDIGVRHVLAEMPTDSALLKIDAGHIFEQWVLTELYYRCQHRGRGHRLSTWRTPSGAEVDAVVETPDELIPIEIKWIDRPRPSDARHVEKFIDLHQERCNRGFIVCRAPQLQQLSDRVQALPWDQF